MKLRIRGNTLRIRLTQGEVARLASGSAVEDSVEFGAGEGNFSYGLVPDAAADEAAAEFSGGRIIVHVPADKAKSWAASDDVGIESAPGAVPSVLIEKDFACLTVRPGEDDADTFPHPGKVC